VLDPMTLVADRYNFRAVSRAHPAERCSVLSWSGGREEGGSAGFITRFQDVPLKPVTGRRLTDGEIRPSVWARKTVRHLSIIVILTPHGEHFPAWLKFTAVDKVHTPLTRLTASPGYVESCYEYRAEDTLGGVTPWIGG
jgi:hypothetical protein